MGFWWCRIFGVCLALLPMLAMAQQCALEEVVAARFVDQGNGTVIDTLTGLQWQRCAQGQSFNHTTQQCDALPGFYNWRGALRQVVAVNTYQGFLQKWAREVWGTR